jgi:alcohol dehydrogenase class IV
MEFRYHLPGNLIFGRGKTNDIGKEAAHYGSKALIVTGGSSARRSGLLDRVQDLLDQAGIQYLLFNQAVPNPTTVIASEGAKTANHFGCDMVIALGGGSVIDFAKAIAFLACNPGDIRDYIYNRATGNDALPLIAVPTTCGTGSEGNGFAVLTDPETGDKKSLRSDHIIPALSIIDSELMETMPKGVLASVGFDALCHSMEAYLSKKSQPMTDMMALQSIQSIAAVLPALYRGDQDAAAWDGITWASTIGGMVIHTAGVTLPHGMEHPASGLKNIVHGRGLAALTPVIADASYPASPERYAKISQFLGGKSAADCGDAIRAFLTEIGLCTTLSEQGITEDDIPWMTENCFKVSAASIANHPLQADRTLVEKLYARAL